MILFSAVHDENHNDTKLIYLQIDNVGLFLPFSEYIDFSEKQLYGRTPIPELKLFLRKSYRL